MMFALIVVDVSEGAEGPADTERAHAGDGTTDQDTRQCCSSSVRHTATGAADTGSNTSSGECVLTGYPCHG